MSKDKVAIGYHQIHQINYLHFTFIGHLAEGMAVEAISRWNEEMTKIKLNGSKISVVYDCREMSGFDTSARKQWQTAMTTHKPLIGVIWIISDNLFILAAAKTMGVLTGFPIKAARTPHEIKG